MDKKQTYITLLDVFNQSIVDPVNPFTLDNPDVLVFNGRTLIGLYIPLKKEQTNPDLLLRRLFLSRLSMSKVVSTVLILDEDTVHAYDNMPEVEAAFDAVYAYENEHDLMNYLRDDIRQRTPIRPTIRRQRMRRFWGTMDFIEKNGIVNNEYSDRVSMREFRVSSWSCPNKERYSRSVNYVHPYLVSSKKKTKQSFKDGFEDLMTLTTMFSYSLSDGILRPNPEASDTFMFLNTESIEDVIKSKINLRTLVFSGYLPGSIGEDFDMQGLCNRYYGFMKDGRYL